MSGKISDLSSASALAGTELVECVQTGSKKTTTQAIANLAVIPLIVSETTLTNPSATALTSGTAYDVIATSASTVTLPAPVANGWVRIRMDPTSTKLLTISTNGGTLYGYSVMWTNEMVILWSDGTNWYKVGGAYIAMVARLRYSGSDSGSIGASTLTKVAAATSVLDNTGLMVVTASNKITCQRAANYRVTASVESYASTGGSSVSLIARAADTSTGTTTIYVQGQAYAPTATGVISPTNTGPVAVAAGADVSLWFEGINDSSQYRGTANKNTFLALEEILSW